MPRNASDTMKLHPPNDPGEFEAVLFDANNVRHRVVSLRAVVTPTPGALSTDKREHVIGAPFRYAPRNGPTGSTATAGWVCSRKGKTIPADRRAGPVVLSSSFETKPMARPEGSVDRRQPCCQFVLQHLADAAFGQVVD